MKSKWRQSDAGNDTNNDNSCISCWIRTWGYKENRPMNLDELKARAERMGIDYFVCKCGIIWRRYRT